MAALISGMSISKAKLYRPIDRGEDEEEELGGKWYNVEFHVKWKRWSYQHCSWDTLSTLSQLGGHKRVLNYCKRQDEMEVWGIHRFSDFDQNLMAGQGV